jgi:hypothetical protein
MIGPETIGAGLVSALLVALGALSAAAGRRVAGVGLGAAGALLLLSQAALTSPDGARLALVGGVVLVVRAMSALEAE